MLLLIIFSLFSEIMEQDKNYLNKDLINVRSPSSKNCLRMILSSITTKAENLIRRDS